MLEKHLRVFHGEGEVIESEGEQPTQELGEPVKEVKVGIFLFSYFFIFFQFRTQAATFFSQYFA